MSMEEGYIYIQQLRLVAAVRARGPLLLSVGLSSVCLLARLLPSLPLAGFWAAWTLAREVLNTALALAFPSRARTDFPEEPVQ